MEIDVELKGQDLVSYYRQALFPSTGFKILLALLFSLPAAVLAGLALYFQGSTALWLGALALLYVVAGWLPYQQSVKRSFEKRVEKRHEARPEKTVVGLHPTGLTIARRKKTETLPWTRIRKVVDGDEAFYFVLSSLNARVVPKRSFGDRFTERAFFFQAVAYQRGMPLSEAPQDQDGPQEDQKL